MHILKKQSGGFSCVGAVGFGNYVCVEGLSLLSLSLVVLSVNLIEALIISVFGVHFSKGAFFWVPDQLLNRYEVSPHLVPAIWRISCLNSNHKGHQKRKWSTVFTSFLHLHFVEDVAPITPRYQLNWQIPVRSWRRMAAWYFGFPLYKERVWLNGEGALSILLVNLPVLLFAVQA